ncbi:MAG: 16S rRNA (guanine(966)-N(2))-methyltransferase RsmD [Chloroflexi bacterium]|nr:MAG: 16S rRNA (guanine(966)-N(2))-methyltransferase RsmD [Chloroflexota bacterium]
MRVIAGSARGIVLAAPRNRATRPITDRVKETVFGILGDRVPLARVLDLYAGSGAIGIEALSRGAEHCCFVEHGREALAILRQNLERARLDDRAEVRAGEVLRFLAAFGGDRFDLAFLDPPFSERAILAPLERLVPHLSPRATVIVRRFWRTELPSVAGLIPWRERRLGETVVAFLEREEEQ